MRPTIHRRSTAAFAAGAAALVFLSSCTAGGGAAPTSESGSQTHAATASVPPAGPADPSAETSSTTDPAPSDSTRSESVTVSPTESRPPTVATSSTAADRWNAQLRRAAQVALPTVPGGTVISIESEEHDTQWEVAIVTGTGDKFEVTLSRDGETVVAGPTDEHSSDADKSKYRSRIAAAKLDYADGLDAIERHTPGSRVDEIELDTERGVVVWEVTAYDPSGREIKLDVDAASGVVAPHR